MKKEFFQNKKVAVTGACGTVGQELVRQLLEEYKISELVGLDNNESELFFLEQRFLEHKNSNFFLADVRDKDKLASKLSGIDFVFHTAAFKHVILCERSPYDAVQTNILGVQNLIKACCEANVKKVIFTSSDKAVNPTNVMGTSKLMGERLMTAAHSNQRNKNPIFACTRFGNVLGSRGSVIPIFREQIKKGGPLTLTDKSMTRFIMSIYQAVQLVINSIALSQGGEVFVTKMPVIYIKDLAEIMVRELAPKYGWQPEKIDIQIIGSKPGEKLYEELMTAEETRRTVELTSYFSVTPAFSSLYKDINYNYPDIVNKNITTPYNSATEPKLSQQDLQNFLLANKLIEGEPGTQFEPTQHY